MQFTVNNLNFCVQKGFKEDKMVIIMELMHYLMRQVVDQGEELSEDQSYENFKELLLRHAVHRPPHSLSVLTLEDVKKIDIFAQSSFFKHFEMYQFILTVKDELRLEIDDFYAQRAPPLVKISEGQPIKFQEIDELTQYFSTEEQEALRKEQEYMMHGPGKIERILNEEMGRLSKHMETKITSQDEEFLTKMGVKK